MKRFKNILLVIRDTHNERGIERAVDLARKNEARLTVIQPDGPLTGSLEIFKGMKSFDRLRAALVRKKLITLNEIRDSLAASGITVDVETPVGSPSVEIVRQVLRNRHDLVITTAQGRTGSVGGLFRSLSLHLIRKCPCPVWVVHPERPRRAGQVLAAVDPADAKDGESSSVNTLIMELATSLARLDGAKLHIVHAYYALELRGIEGLLMKRHGTDSKEDYEKCVESAVAERKHQLEKLLQNHPLDSVEHEIHFVEGAPDRIIPKIADDQNVDVMVLGAIADTKHPGHCIGTTAEDIIHQIGCSVLAVKPAGFVSPITL